MKKFVVACLTSCLMLPFMANAQTSYPYGSTDPQNPIVVCDKDTLTIQNTDVTPLGSGVQNTDGKFEDSPNCFALPRDYSNFFTFVPKVSGVLEFTIRPIDGFSELDWALYEYDLINALSPIIDTLDITDPAVYLACNYYDNSKAASGFSETGMRVNSPASNSPFAPTINVVAGTKYMLMVDNDLSNSNDPAVPGPDTSNAGYYILWGGTFEIEPLIDYDLTVTSPMLKLASADPSIEVICCTPGDITFDNTTTYQVNSNFAWDFQLAGTSSAQDPVINFTIPGDYVGTYNQTTTRDGCVYTMARNFTILPPSDLYIPTAFSPNADNINDTWAITHSGLNNYVCRIFNRWGEQVFLSNDPDEAWDGEKAPDGVYMFVISADGLDRQSYAESGTVVIIR